MIDIQELELEFNAFYGDKENEHTLLARMFPLIEEVKRLREQQKQIHDLFAEVLPRKDGLPQMGVMLWGVESELKRVVSKVAILLGMAESEEE